MASLGGATLAKANCLAPPWITCRSPGPVEVKSSRSHHLAAGLVAVDRPLFRTLGLTPDIREGPHLFSKVTVSKTVVNHYRSLPQML